MNRIFKFFLTYGFFENWAPTEEEIKRRHRWAKKHIRYDLPFVYWRAASKIEQDMQDRFAHASALHGMIVSAHEKIPDSSKIPLENFIMNDTVKAELLKIFAEAQEEAMKL